MGGGMNYFTFCTPLSEEQKEVTVSSVITAIYCGDLDGGFLEIRRAMKRREKTLDLAPVPKKRIRVVKARG